VRVLHFHEVEENDEELGKPYAQDDVRDSAAMRLVVQETEKRERHSPSVF